MTRRTLVALTTSAALGAAALIGASLLASPEASATATKEETKMYRYQLEALGGHAGEAAFTVGAMQSVKGKRVRPVRIEAATGGLAKAVFSATASGVTFIDSKGLPVLANVDAMTPKGPWKGSSTYKGRRLDAEWTIGEKTHKRKARLKKRPLDLVGAFAWALTLPRKPGKSFSRPLFDGKKVYELKASFGKPKRIQVPMGMRDAIPLEIVVKRGKFRRKITYWIGSDDGVPYKLAFKYGHLGTVEALLVQMKIDGEEV